MKIFFWILFSFTMLYGVIIPSSGSVGGAVVPNDNKYYKKKQGNVEIIYTKENLPFAIHAAKVEPSIHGQYEKLYGWKLDEKLSVGLISNHNQIANGFSTQFPNNRQINYVGGTSKIDYFTSISWLDTLLYHETAHNYQYNVKASWVSRMLHKLFANGSIIVPIFTLPNLTENSFMLEGNAVLNESWHGNGGRLYSGRFLAQTILQAKADNIKASEVYNTKLKFPYGEIVYIQGGFYNLYMAQKYGLNAIDSYFKYHSEDWYWPFFTNASMKKATGVDFEDSLETYAQKYKALAKFQVLAKGELIASSQFFTKLNSDAKEIFFLTNENGSRASNIVRVNKKDGTLSEVRKSFFPAKLIKDKDKFYTQASAHISPTKIVQGLYDEDKLLKNGSASKMVQGYLSDGKEVYFDVPSSYREPQLYVGKKFYAKVNSSVYIDKNDNIYYFVQTGKKRTLYKNKTPLISLRGYYGFVNDVDSQGGIYFISNTKYGSSLFLYKDAKVSRASEADNVIEARLINDKEVLIAAISEKDYYYVKTDLMSIDDIPFEVKYFFEDKGYFKKIKEKNTQNIPDLQEKYNSFMDMRYSGLDFSFGTSTSGKNIGILNLRYQDPLGQNALNAYINKDLRDVTIGGVGYQSALFLLSYGFYAYSVLDTPKYDKNHFRNNGIIAHAKLPLYQAGYTKATLGASYYQDYYTRSREPLSFYATLKKYEQFGKSRFANYLNALKIYATQDREDTLYGVQYNFIHDLPAEFYISLDAKYSSSANSMNTLKAQNESRGVKLSTSAFASDLDTSVIDMRSIGFVYYVKDAGYIDIGVKKVLNFSSYWFTFPISLQRETLSIDYKYFDIRTFSNNPYQVTELRASLNLDLVFFNNAVIPFSLEYIYNDSLFAYQKEQLFYGLSLAF